MPKKGIAWQDFLAGIQDAIGLPAQKDGWVLPALQSNHLEQKPAELIQGRFLLCLDDAYC